MAGLTLDRVERPWVTDVIEASVGPNGDDRWMFTRLIVLPLQCKRKDWNCELRI
jgi:hypothetical protein